METYISWIIPFLKRIEDEKQQVFIRKYYLSFDELYNSSYCSFDAGVLPPYRVTTLDGSVSDDSDYAEDDYDDA